MKRAIAPILASAAVAAMGCLAHPAPAAADTTATTRIAQLKIISRGAKNYQFYHGAIWLSHDKATHNYRWGGSQCAGLTLSDINVSMLFSAFRANYSVNVDYEERLVKGSRYRCITGFSVSKDG